MKTYFSYKDKSSENLNQKKDFDKQHLFLQKTYPELTFFFLFFFLFFFKCFKTKRVFFYLESFAFSFQKKNFVEIYPKKMSWE